MVILFWELISAFSCWVLDGFYRIYDEEIVYRVGYSTSLMVRLTAKAIECSASPFEGIDHVHGGHSLSSSVLSISHGIANHILQEDLENPCGLLVNQSVDSLHSASSRQSSNRLLHNPLNVVVEDHPVPFCSFLAQSLASLAAA
jgi:hypothetical protein